MVAIPTYSFNIALNLVSNTTSAVRMMNSITQATGGYTKSLSRATQAGMSFRTLIGAGMAWSAYKIFTDKAIRQNMDFEKSIFGIGAILNANLGNPQSVEALTKWIGVGQQMMLDLENDAAKSAAYLKDYVMMAKTIAQPVLTATHSVTALRDVTDLAVGAATALGVDYEHAATGIQLALMGVARAQNEMIRLLGINATTFNRMNLQQRYKDLENRLKKFSLVNDMFMNTFVGAWSTFTDNLGIALRRGVEPFVKTFTYGLRAINAGISLVMGPMSHLLRVATLLAAIEFGPGIGKMLLRFLGTGGIFKTLWAGRTHFTEKLFGFMKTGTSLGINKRLGRGGMPWRQALSNPAAWPYYAGYGTMPRGTLHGIGTRVASGARGAWAGARTLIAATPGALMGLLRGAGGLLVRGAGALGGAATAGLGIVAFAVAGGVIKAISMSMSGGKKGEGIFSRLGEAMSILYRPFTLFWELIKGLFGAIVDFVAYGLKPFFDLLSTSFVGKTIKWLIDAVADAAKMLADSAYLLQGFFNTLSKFMTYTQGNLATLLTKGGAELWNNIYTEERNKAINKMAGETPKTQVNIGEVRIIQNFREHVNPDNVALSITEHLKQIAANPVKA